ncbi:MAG: hypothetical protein AAFV80_19500, partial [Bacteroidota bacterium]
MRAFEPKTFDPEKETVVLIPGILGSNLKDESGRRIWLGKLKLFHGIFAELVNEKLDLAPEGPIDAYYGALMRYLSDRYNVIPFGYDWRQDLNQSAQDLGKRLEDVIYQEHPDYSLPVHFICHSMGGLVFRIFAFDVFPAHQFPKQLNLQLSTILFMGVPNKGSYTTLRHLMGRSRMLNIVRLLDFEHNRKDLINILSRFPALIALLPDDEATNTQLENVSDFWEVYLPHVHPEFKQNLKQRASILKSLRKTDWGAYHFIHIVGVGKKATPIRMELDPKEKQIALLGNHAGDGTVPWSSGVPNYGSDQTIYYINKDHQKICKVSDSFQGIVELLANRRTDRIASTAPFLNRSLESEFDVSEELPTWRTSPSPETPMAEIIWEDDEALFYAPDHHPLTLKVTHGDLGKAEGIVFGSHFIGDGISGTEKVIDRYLSKQLSNKLTNLSGMYPGPIGTSSVFWAAHAPVIGAVIVGIGEIGELTPSSLKDSVQSAVFNCMLEFRDKKGFEGKELTISPILIGSGYGGLTIEKSVTSILRAVIAVNKDIRALNRNPERSVLPVINKVEFIELYYDRVIQACRAITRIMHKEEFKSELQFEEGAFKLSKVAGRQFRIPNEVNRSWWNKIKIDPIMAGPNNSKLKGFKFTTMQDKAIAEVSNLNSFKLIDLEYIELATSSSSWEATLSKMLFEKLIPNPLKMHLKENRNTIWVVDKHSANIPLEILLPEISKDGLPISVAAGLIRQIAERKPFQTENPTARKRALVIANPQVNADWNLPQAEQEGRKLAKLLSENGYHVDAFINSTAFE